MNDLQHELDCLDQQVALLTESVINQQKLLRSITMTQERLRKHASTLPHSQTPQIRTPTTITATLRQYPTDGYIRLPQVLELIPVGKSTWWRGITEGRFPKPLKLTPRTTVWRVQDIRNLMMSTEQTGR